jgi:hypothetical protein
MAKTRSPALLGAPMSEDLDKSRTPELVQAFYGKDEITGASRRR